jgi:hypothetical protein
MVSDAAGSTADTAAIISDSAEFDYERSDVYRVALQFQRLVPGLMPRRGYAALRDQLDRASASILLNTAERARRGLPGGAPPHARAAAPREPDAHQAGPSHATHGVAASVTGRPEVRRPKPWPLPAGGDCRRIEP